MKLQHIRPLAAFDIESTGPNPLEDKIIELGIIKLMPDGSETQKRWGLNPGCPIPAEATKVHGITDEMVKDCLLFKDVAEEIAEELKDTDFLTFNGNAYDIPMLAAEFNRAGVSFNFEPVNFVDVGNLYKIFAPRTLEAAVMQYLGVKHEGAHGAIADTHATINVLQAMFIQHGDNMPSDVEKLAIKSNYDRKRLDLAGKFAYDKDNQVIYTFGKHKGKPVNSEIGYVQWMLEAKDPQGKYSFTEDTRNVCLKLLGRDNMVNNSGPVTLPKYAPNNSTKPHTGKLF